MPALALAVAAHLAMGDRLLFHSDLWSLALYLGSMTCIGTATATLLASGLLLPFPAHLRRRMIRSCALAVATLLCASFLFLALLYLGWFGPEARLRWLGLGSLVIAGLAVWLRRDRDDVIHRLEGLGLAMLAGLIVFLPAAISLRPSAPAEEGGPVQVGGRHLALIILDGMPSQYVRVYDPSVGATAWDDLLDHGLVFRGMRTVAAWTHAYFGTLYSGRSYDIYRKGFRRVEGENLMARLQRAGVASRWITYHRNGIPEGAAGHTSGYAGLRSYLLTQHYTWIPEILRLDYHVVMAGRSISKNLRNKLAISVFDTLNAQEQGNSDNAFLDLLLPQLRSLRTRSNRTFTLFHINWSRTGLRDPLGPEALPQAQKGMDGEVAENTPELLRKWQRDHIRANDNRYGPELESYAAVARHQATIAMAALGERVSSFVHALEQDSTLRDTTVIVTADHGSLYRDGRFWYGFHPQEDVIRAFFVVLNSGQCGIDDRLFSTPDITQSILDFFEVEPGLATDARSIFAEGEAHYVASVTQRSDRHKEWFLVIFTDGAKYVVNLHPEGEGETWIYRVDRYTEIPAGESIGPPPLIRSLVPESLRQFAIDPADIHRAYR